MKIGVLFNTFNSILTYRFLSIFVYEDINRYEVNRHKAVLPIGYMGFYNNEGVNEIFIFLLNYKNQLRGVSHTHL